MKRLGIVNQKGGVGKTTTAVNLATYLALLDRRVLLVDLDPQANATSGLGVAPSPPDAGTAAVLLEGAEPAAQTVHLESYGLDLLPAGEGLVAAAAELLDDPFRLRTRLAGVEAGYDFVLFDAPPSLGPLTINVLAAAEGLIVPLQTEYYALEGIARLVETVEKVRGALNPGLRILGIVLTMYDGRTLLSQQVEQNAREHFGDRVFWTVIPRNVRLSEAPSYGEPIAKYAPTSAGAQAYGRLAAEVMRRVEKA
ncbi:ParA family protein [Oceanithermus desulfurans]|uniref:Chromosome partitioning protein Soj n=3 Tax=Oceanithermus TaxID=208447 RepID=A0A511RJV7_9DEIN|nr:ParA family protein [Oceanithermus desulfurans]MBB6029415.1 chromosome partitioning protein [Oceanithermus desulfurans]GEM89929.1 chromosome partitioning protein Soj [Oceanithermus desulfurans NBRC 100063]HHO58023.1 ParA family protein [Oceanithermus profundus]